MEAMSTNTEGRIVNVADWFYFRNGDEGELMMRVEVMSFGEEKLYFQWEARIFG
jgi:hypothetical protein